MENLDSTLNKNIKSYFLITYIYVLWLYLSVQSARPQINRVLKLKLIVPKRKVILGRDRGHPYMLSTTILSGIYCCDCSGCLVPYTNIPLL